MRRLLIAAALIVAASYAALASEGEYVYRVTAEHCGSSLEVHTQTGFAIRGKAGIITALHGIVGCDKLSAVSEGAALSNLTLDEVDIPRDLAIVGVSRVLGRDGLISGSVPARSGPARVLGHPHAISGLYEMTLEVPNPPVRPLREIVPGEMFNALQARRSPQGSVNVVSINGDLQPGHSGAPIFDRDGRVVAVASGGIGRGEYGIAWAIPLEDAQWRLARDERAELTRLARRASEGLFWSPGGAGKATNYPRRVSMWRYSDGRVSGVFTDPAKNTVYVNTFEKIRAFNFEDESVADIQVGSLIQGMALSPDARTAYVVDARPTTVLRLVDLVNRRVVQEIAMPQKKVCEPAMITSGELLFVPLPNDQAVWVYNTRSSRSHTIHIDGQSPCAIAVSRRTENVYLGSANREIRVFRISDFHRSSGVIEPTSIIRVGLAPARMAEDFEGSYLYVANCRSNTISVVDLNRGAEASQIAVGKCPWGIAITPDSRWIYVANRDSATVSVIDIARKTLVDTLLVNRDPTDIAIGRNGDRVYVGHFYQNGVTLIE